jgi:hypothetical protein
MAAQASRPRGGRTQPEVSRAPAVAEVHREYRQLADLYVESGFDEAIGQRLDRVFRLRRELARQEPVDESGKRSERRRVERAAERRLRAERTRTVRRCACGCGRKIPPEADPRQKFIDSKHRFAFHNRKKAAPSAPDNLRVAASQKPHGKAKSEGSKSELCNVGNCEGTAGSKRRPKDPKAPARGRPAEDRTPRNIILRPLRLPPMKPIRKERGAP